MPYVLRAGLADLNCPGDVGCPGYVDPAVNNAIQAALAGQQNIGTDAGGWSPSPTYTVPFDFGRWLSANAGSVALGAGALVLFMAVTRR